MTDFPTTPGTVVGSSVVISGVCCVWLCLQLQVVPVFVHLGCGEAPSSLSSTRDSVQATVTPLPAQDSPYEWEPILSTSHGDPNRGTPNRGRDIPILHGCPGTSKANLIDRFLCNSPQSGNWNYILGWGGVVSTSMWSRALA